MDIQTALNHLVDGKDFSSEEMQSIMRQIMQGELSPAQIAGFLVALRLKGETVDEIAAAAQVMREFATKVELDLPHTVDIVGTGGDGSSTFNISTTAAFVIAAAGGHVAKHNNRSVSSKSGSADVLEAVGAKLELKPEQVADCVKQVGVGFMFAPIHHQAMRHAAGPRRELGLRTVFNLLGPLTNPAAVPNQLIGVFAKDWLLPIAQVMQKLGSQHSIVVHSCDGMDEISISAPTEVAELYKGEINTYQITPEQFDLDYGDREAITVSNPEESRALMLSVLDNQAGPAKDIVMLNAGAAIYAAGITPDLASGVTKANEIIANGSARRKLDELVKFTQKITAAT